MSQDGRKRIASNPLRALERRMSDMARSLLGVMGPPQARQASTVKPLKSHPIHADRFLQSLLDAFASSPGWVGYLWSRTNMFKEISSIVTGLKAWPDVTVASNVGGLRVCLHGVALGYVQWNGRIELPFGPELRERLVDEQMAYPDPDRREGPVIFDVRNSTTDVDRALWLFRLAYLTSAGRTRSCA